MQAYDRFLTGLSRISSTFEDLHDTEGSIRQAFDALFVYTEQELQQAKQQVILSELRKQVMEVREDTERKLAEYGKEVENLAKDVLASEKKLQESREKPLRRSLITNLIKTASRLRKPQESLCLRAPSVASMTRCNT
jgi:septal ring factor EnvC (AmiA/AmiB activator)